MTMVNSGLKGLISPRYSYVILCYSIHGQDTVKDIVCRFIYHAMFHAPLHRGNINCFRYHAKLHCVVNTISQCSSAKPKYSNCLLEN